MRSTKIEDSQDLDRTVIPTTIDCYNKSDALWDDSTMHKQDTKHEESLYQFLDVEALVNEFSQRLHRSFSVSRMRFSLPELEIEADLRRQTAEPPLGFDLTSNTDNRCEQLQYKMRYGSKSLGTLTILPALKVPAFEKTLIDNAVNSLCGPLYNSIRYAHACRSGYKDALTGLYNRAALEALLFDNSIDSNRSITAVLISDMDRFKWINDNYGHTVGDTALTQFATRVSSIVDNDGSVFRYGGDEFVIAFDAVSDRRCIELAEEIRSGVESCSLNKDTPLIATIGATRVHTGESLRDAFTRADSALLSGKNDGGNKVVWSE